MKEIEKWHEKIDLENLSEDEERIFQQMGNTRWYWWYQVTVSVNNNNSLTTFQHDFRTADYRIT